MAFNSLIRKMDNIQMLLIEIKSLYLKNSDLEIKNQDKGMDSSISTADPPFDLSDLVTNSIENDEVLDSVKLNDVTITSNGGNDEDLMLGFKRSAESLLQLQDEKVQLNEGNDVSVTMASENGEVLGFNSSVEDVLFIPDMMHQSGHIADIDKGTFPDLNKESSTSNIFSVYGVDSEDLKFGIKRPELYEEKFPTIVVQDHQVGINSSVKDNNLSIILANQVAVEQPSIEERNKSFVDVIAASHEISVNTLTKGWKHFLGFHIRLVFDRGRFSVIAGVVRILDIHHDHLYNAVKIKINVFCNCGGDVHYLKHGRCGDYMVTEPMVLGYECAGMSIIAEVGSEVKSVNGYVVVAASAIGEEILSTLHKWFDRRNYFIGGACSMFEGLPGNKIVPMDGILKWMLFNAATSYYIVADLQLLQVDRGDRQLKTMLASNILNDEGIFLVYCWLQELMVELVYSALTCGVCGCRVPDNCFQDAHILFIHVSLFLEGITKSKYSRCSCISDTGLRGFQGMLWLRLSFICRDYSSNRAYCRISLECLLWAVVVVLFVFSAVAGCLF